MNTKSTWLISLFYLATCIAYGKDGSKLSSEDVLKVNQTSVCSYFYQSNVFAPVNVTINASAVGVLGGLVSGFSDSEAHKARKKRLEPLLEPLKAYNPRDIFYPLLSNVVSQTSWLKAQGFEIKNCSDKGKVTQINRKEAAIFSKIQSYNVEPPENGAAILNVGSSYDLQDDFSRLEFKTVCDFFLPGEYKKPAATIVLFSYSKKISDQTGEKLMLLWMTNNAVLFREAMEDIVKSNIKLASTGLSVMGGKIFENDFPQAKIEGWRIPGYVLEEDANYVSFLIKADNRGNYFSYPSRDIKKRAILSKKKPEN